MARPTDARQRAQDEHERLVLGIEHDPDEEDRLDDPREDADEDEAEREDPERPPPASLDEARTNARSALRPRRPSTSSAGIANAHAKYSQTPGRDEATAPEQDPEAVEQRQQQQRRRVAAARRTASRASRAPRRGRPARSPGSTPPTPAARRAICSSVEIASPPRNWLSSSSVSSGVCSVPGLKSNDEVVYVGRQQRADDLDRHDDDEHRLEQRRRVADEDLDRDVEGLAERERPQPWTGAFGRRSPPRPYPVRAHRDEDRLMPAAAPPRGPGRAGSRA